MAGVKVLVTTDGSNLSDKAIDTAIDLTKQLGGELIGMTSVVGEAPTGGFEAAPYLLLTHRLKDK